jgi:hypothetical protein
MCSYSADDYGMFQYLCHYPAAKHAKGEMRKIFDWDRKSPKLRHFHRFKMTFHLEPS